MTSRWGQRLNLKKIISIRRKKIWQVIDGTLWSLPTTEGHYFWNIKWNFYRTYNWNNWLYIHQTVHFGKDRPIMAYPLSGKPWCPRGPGVEWGLNIKQTKMSIVPNPSELDRLSPLFVFGPDSMNSNKNKNYPWVYRDIICDVIFTCREFM